MKRERQDSELFATSLGGPVVRDRLWFFTGYQYLRDYDSQPGTDPLLPRTYEQDKIFAKLTWRLAPGWQLVQSVHQEFWVNPEQPTIAKPFEATSRSHASVPAITFGHLTHSVSTNTVWDVRAGRFVYSREDDPSTGNRTTVGRSDSVTGVFSGAPPTFGALTLIRTTAKATISHYRPGLLGADHQGKMGVQVERGEHESPAVIPTGVRYVDGNFIPAEASCKCTLVVYFGTRNGERRAYLTADYIHDNPGTVVDLEIASGVLVVNRTNVFPPGTYTLSGVVTELTLKGQAPVEDAGVWRLNEEGAGWRVGRPTRVGSMRFTVMTVAGRSL